MKYNIVLHERIVELSEFKSKHEKLKDLLSNWKVVCVLAISTITFKVIIEQIIMLVKSA